MHYTHVKCKEQLMEPITLERYLNEPGLDLRLQAEARRARSQAMHRLLKELVERLTPCAQPVRWLARRSTGGGRVSPVRQLRRLPGGRGEGREPVTWLP
jgi:hypothetical protein